MNIIPWSFFVVCCLVGQSCATWTFGMDNPNYLTISRKSGQILPLHKTTKIRLEEPPCLVLKFVHVTVNNMLSTPAVAFDKHTLTVSISYTLLASSTSTYDVIGKGLRIRDCNQGNRVRNFQKGKMKGTTNNKKMNANSNHYNEGKNGQTGGGGYAGDGYHEGASGKAGSGGHVGNGGGHVGGGHTGSGNHGGGSGHAGYDGHGGAGSHAVGGGYEGSGNHGGAGGHTGSGNHGGDSGHAGYDGHGGGSHAKGGGYEGSGNHVGTGGYTGSGHHGDGNGHAGYSDHGGNGGGHGGGGAYAGSNNYGGSGGHGGAGSVEVYVDEHYDIKQFHGTNSDIYDAEPGIYINENADGTGKYSPDILDSYEYGWGSYQFLNGGKTSGVKKSLPRGKYSAARKPPNKLRGGYDNRLLGSNHGGGRGFGGGSGYSGSSGHGGADGNCAVSGYSASSGSVWGSGNDSHRRPQGWWTSWTPW